MSEIIPDAEEIQRIYDWAQTCHDGKWLMFEPSDTALFDDFIRLLRIKRKTNRKSLSLKTSVRKGSK